MDAIDAYAEVVNATANMQVSMDDSWTAEAESSTSKSRNTDPRDLIVDIREYDVPYYLRVAIDNGTPSFLCGEGFAKSFLQISVLDFGIR